MGKKLTIEFIRKEFAEEGYILLTTEYKNAHQKLRYICSRGHRHSICWSNWSSKKKCRCPYCNGNAKLTIEFIRAEFAKEGYTLLTKIYKNNSQKLKYICPMGHRHSVTRVNWQQGKRCPCFSNQMKPTIEFIRSEFAKEGYTLLTEIYENNEQKLKYICPRGHRHTQNMSRKTSNLHSKSVRQLLTWSHYKFKMFLRNKALEFDKTVIDVCEAFTSKTESWSGRIRNIGRSKVIGSGEIKLDRDLNGARNIFIRSLGDSPSLMKIISSAGIVNVC